MDGKTGFARNRKKIKSIKGQEDVDGHNPLRPGGIHKEDGINIQMSAR